MLLVKQHYKIGICFCLCDEKKFIQKQPHSRLQRVIGFQPMRRKEIYSEATSFEVATCQGLQKSAKADVLFIMLLVKQHYKIGICFCLCDEKKFIQKQPHSRLQRVIGFQPMRREEIYSEATSFEIATCSYELFSLSFSQSHQVTINQCLLKGL